MALPKVSSSTKCASLVGLCLLITFLMFFINFDQFGLPYALVIGILVTSALVSGVSLIGFIYFKFRYWDKTNRQMVSIIVKILCLSAMVYFIMSFSVDIISSQKKTSYNITQSSTLVA